MITNYINKWNQTIDDEIEEQRELKEVIKHMESPFGFIEGFQIDQMFLQVQYKKQDERAHEKPKEIEIQLPPEMEEKMKQLDEREQVYEKKFDIIADHFATNLGYDSIPWFRITIYMLAIYMVLTCLVMFARPDFINVTQIRFLIILIFYQLTVCSAAMYMMGNTD